MLPSDPKACAKIVAQWSVQPGPRAHGVDNECDRIELGERAAWCAVPRNGRGWFDPGQEVRTCSQCDRAIFRDQPDPCFGVLPGVKWACCGHGLERGYVAFDNGVVIRFDNVSA